MPAFSLPTLLRAVALWLLLMAAESAQGAMREWLFGPDMAFAARQAAVVVGTGVIVLISWVSLKWLRLRSDAAALAVGALWVALTVAFEVALGRALGLSQERMLEDYDLLRGGLMPLGLLAMGATPFVVRRLQARGEGRT
ncbi:MAG: hypothetical protein JNK30_06030 [Phenylobacterium sp.]|uniref:hypothetical protein n=1 Tax=Phenylobacterium sp. TaxID=1871053 RepID=UPI001A5B872D|nr:hypothetical protein [Phenylobacterium sp.]MBL8770923.1 hypothetical protein [Phenylobacterium sp.]